METTNVRYMTSQDPTTHKIVLFYTHTASANNTTLSCVAIRHHIGMRFTRSPFAHDNQTWANNSTGDHYLSITHQLDNNSCKYTWQMSLLASSPTRVTMYVPGRGGGWVLKYT